ncbi:MAG: IclR family transcriptional regulator [Pseudomonadota bacterium]|jgi:IclR family pca regulon transcriptional regulator
MNAIVAEDADNGVGALARGLRILSLFDVRSPEMSFIEIQNGSGLPKATTYRLLKTLVSQEFILFDEFKKRYYPGPKVMTLGFSALNAYSLVDSARHLMEEVGRETEQTVGLNIRDGVEIVTCYRVIPACNIVNVNIPIGHRAPIEKTGTGRLFLAFDKSAEFEKAFSERVLPNLDNFARKILSEEVSFAKRHKFSYNDEDTALGYRSVSVPVFKFGDQIIATLYVSAASSQLNLRALIEKAVPELRKASLKLSLILGASRESLANLEPDISTDDLPSKL